MVKNILIFAAGTLLGAGGTFLAMKKYCTDKINQAWIDAQEFYEKYSTIKANENVISETTVTKTEVKVDIPQPDVEVTDLPHVRKKEDKYVGYNNMYDGNKCEVNSALISEEVYENTEYKQEALHVYRDLVFTDAFFNRIDISTKISGTVEAHIRDDIDKCLNDAEEPEVYYVRSRYFADDKQYNTIDYAIWFENDNFEDITFADMPESR